MRIIKTETKVFSFNELAEDAQDRAIEGLYNVNVDFDWWDSVYEDAATIGLIIEEFDIDRGSYCRGKWSEDAEDVANLICANHGKDCETYKDALQYACDRTALVEKYSDGKHIDRVIEDYESDFDDECNELDDEFLRTICEDYRIMLQEEYEYLTSRKAIIETIEANSYDFTEDGELA